MYDYSEIDTFHIENIDYEIHIFGVKPLVLPIILLTFIVTMCFSPIFGDYTLIIGFVMVGFVLIISNRFFYFEQRGQPLEYGPFLQNLRSVIAIESIFLNIKHIEHQNENEYLGDYYIEE